MTAYYNEIDPFAAAWLQNLIAAGHIAPGVVDTRSIEDVTPDDLRGFTQCHFFAGIGVWSYALRRAGWDDDRPVWTGSCPCQPFSAAGKGGGFADERHLWPAFFHLIEQCDPAVVIGEQVASKDGLAWLDLVRADVEGSGRAFAATDLCAAGVGAPHIRQRTFWVADGSRGGCGERWNASRSGCGGHVDGSGNAPVRLADAQGERGRERPGQISGAASADIGAMARQGHGYAAWTNSAADRLDDDDDARSQGHAGHDGAASGRQEPGRSVAAAGVSGGMADSDGRGRGRIADGERCFDNRHAVERNESDGRAEHGGEAHQYKPAGPTNGFWRDADWLYCRDGKWRPVEPGTFPLAHGAANRVGRLRGYGNAIVAPVAETFIRAVMACI